MRLVKRILLPVALMVVVANSFDCLAKTTPQQAMECCRRMPCMPQGQHGEDCCKTMAPTDASFVLPTATPSLHLGQHLIGIAPIHVEYLALLSGDVVRPAQSHAPPGTHTSALQSLRI